MPPEPKLIRLVDQPPYQVDMVAGGGPDLVISFASIGHDASRAPSPEFVGSATAEGRTALFMTDARRSWASAPGFADVLAKVVDMVGRKGKILTIGQSMGGFMAIRAAKLLGADVVLAFGPQSAPLADPRWRHWTAGLPPLPALDLPPTAYLFHGLADDLNQALGFAPQPGLDHFLFPGITHSALGPHLKAFGLYPALIACALAKDRRRMIRILGKAGGVLR